MLWDPSHLAVGKCVKSSTACQKIYQTLHHQNFQPQKSESPFRRSVQTLQHPNYPPLSEIRTLSDTKQSTISSSNQQVHKQYLLLNNSRQTFRHSAEIKSFRASPEKRSHTLKWDQVNTTLAYAKQTTSTIVNQVKDTTDGPHNQRSKLRFYFQLFEEQYEFICLV